MNQPARCPHCWHLHVLVRLPAGSQGVIDADFSAPARDATKPHPHRDHHPDPHPYPYPKPRRASSLACDRGSGAIWAVICAAVLGVVAWAAVAGIGLTACRLRAQTTADLAALTAVSRDCAAAGAVAAANGASLHTCTQDPADSSITLRVQLIVRQRPLPHFTMSAAARAGVR